MEDYLNVMKVEMQPVQNTIDKHTNMHKINPFIRLQLPVAGISEGYANTSSAALLKN